MELAIFCFIIIKSDHGKPNGYYKKFPFNKNINESRNWGVGRYKTFVMVKEMNKNRKELIISNKHVFLADLAKTYCNFVKKTSFCESLNGNDLTMPEDQFKNMEYEILIPKDKNTFHTAILFLFWLIPHF